jgi:glutaredoxin-dependent peroxiredoxin
MALKVGDVAPDFKLFSTDKKEVALSDFAGKKVLILFFPFAFTGVCTDELCSIRDNKAMYDGIDAEILSISVDSPFTLAKFKEIQGYNFSLLSDFNKEVSTAYEAIYDTFALGTKGVSKRSAFVIDGAGKIQYAEVLENAGELPNFDAINEVLKSI